MGNKGRIWQVLQPHVSIAFILHNRLKYIEVV